MLENCGFIPGASIIYAVQKVQNAEVDVMAPQQIQECQDLGAVPGKPGRTKAMMVRILRGAALTSSLSQAPLDRSSCALFVSANSLTTIFSIYLYLHSCPPLTHPPPLEFPRNQTFCDASWDSTSYFSLKGMFFSSGGAESSPVHSASLFR